MSSKPNTEYESEKIERYLKGEMVVEEQEVFEEQMKADAGLRSAVKEEYRFLLAIEHDERLSSDLKDSYQKLQAIRDATDIDVSNSGSKSTYFSRFSSTLVRWSKWAALVALVMGGAAYWAFFSDDQSLFQAYYEKPPNTLVFEQRGAQSGDQPEQVQTIMERYENEQYQAALNLMDEYLNGHQNAELAFYKGVMLIETHNPEKAIRTFNRIKASQQEPEAKVLWYTALAYLANDQKAKAKEQLQLLIKSAAPRYHTDAQNLLQALNLPN